MELEQFTHLVINEFGPSVLEGTDEAATPKALIIDRNLISETCLLLRDHQETFFDMLSCLTGLDNGPEQNTMEVIYNLYSIPFEHSLMLKVILPREKPEIETVSPIWKTANWHEREAFDLFGIQFKNHPDLRRILMPADWKGFPMRKDYTEPETYRGMQTIREEDAPS